ncbi:MAG: helix-turn-helix transcriptional regulator [Bacteroidota bacterium]
MEERKYNRIKAVLAELGITSAQLSENIGRNKVSVSRWCTNESQPSIETLYDIAEFLDVNVKDLLVDNKKD